jgi:hypothetical protein
MMLPADLDAQRRGGQRPPPRDRTVVLRGQVFIGGYFYDPRFGPYPWWPRAAYPHWYVPIYDRRAEVRVLATPEEAAVYVDGFYAGIVEDFDGVFQGLPLAPGGHTIVLYLEGYRTAQYNLYLRPGSAFKLRHAMERLPPGERSEPPTVAPQVPPPPPGSYRSPVAPGPLPAPTQAPVVAVGFGTLDLRVQPAGAEVRIDGTPWASSDPGHFVVEVSEGRHRVDVFMPGYRRFSTEIDVREGATTPLNVSLPRETT